MILLEGIGMDGLRISLNGTLARVLYAEDLQTVEDGADSVRAKKEGSSSPKVDGNDLPLEEEFAPPVYFNGKGIEEPVFERLAIRNTIEMAVGTFARTKGDVNVQADRTKSHGLLPLIGIRVEDATTPPAVLVAEVRFILCDFFFFVFDRRLVIFALGAALF